jgi:hypothetical protein
MVGWNIPYTWLEVLYSYGHLLVITGYFYGFIHSINGGYKLQVLITGILGHKCSWFCDRVQLWRMSNASPYHQDPPGTYWREGSDRDFPSLAWAKVVSRRWYPLVNGLTYLWKIPFWMGKSTISKVMFNSKLFVSQGKAPYLSEDVRAVRGIKAGSTDEGLPSPKDAKDTNHHYNFSLYLYIYLYIYIYIIYISNTIRFLWRNPYVILFYVWIIGL